jgi:hypothetical protein
VLAGCRVVCSDIPAYREIGARHCRLVPLIHNAEGDFVVAVREVLRERRPVPATLPQLSSSVIGGQYLHLYQTLIAVTAFSFPKGASDRIEPHVRQVPVAEKAAAHATQPGVVGSL